MTKRTLSLLLVIAMICSLGVMAMADTTPVMGTGSVTASSDSAYVGAASPITITAQVNGIDTANPGTITWSTDVQNVLDLAAATSNVDATGKATVTATANSAVVSDTSVVVTAKYNVDSSGNSTVSGTCTITVKPDAVSTVTIMKDGATAVSPQSLSIGNSLTLSASVAHTNGTTTSAVTWNVVNDSSAVTFVNSGNNIVITGKASGSATVTASANGTSSSAVTVNVVEGPSITSPATPVTKNALVGTTVSLPVTATPAGATYAWYKDGSTTAIEGATAATYTFTAADSDIGTHTYSCGVTANGITVKSAVFTVNVKAPFTVTISGSNSVAKGKTVNYSATVASNTIDSNGNFVPGKVSGGTVAWTSGNTKSLTVAALNNGLTDANGISSATATGVTETSSVTINASYTSGGKTYTGSTTIAVTAAVTDTIKFVKNTDTLNTNRNTAFTLTAPSYYIRNGSTDVSANYNAPTLNWVLSTGSVWGNTNKGSTASITDSQSSAGTYTYVCTVTATPRYSNSGLTTLSDTYTVTVYVGTSIVLTETLSGTDPTTLADLNSDLISQVRSLAGAYSWTDVASGMAITFGAQTTTYGTLYTDSSMYPMYTIAGYYACNKDTAAANTTSYRYFHNMYFVPVSTTSGGSYVVNFTVAYGGNSYPGTLTIVVPSNTAGNADIYYNTTTNGTVGLSEQDFIDWFQAQHTSSYVLQSVKFSNTPSSGTMYCGGSRVNTSTTYYTANYLTSTSYKALADLSYTASSAVGCYAVGFTCTGKASSSSSASTVTNSGTMYLCVTKSGVGTVSYNVYTGTSTSLAESDFTSVYKTATGVTTSSPKFSIRIITAPSMGTLYRSGSTSSAYKIAKSQSTNYYVNASTSGSYNVRDITYVPGNYTSGKDTVVYGAYDSNGTLQYIGNLVFNYGTKNSSLTTYSEGYTFKTSDFVKSTDTDPVVTVQFTSTTAGGYLYRDYTHGTGTSVKTTDKFYTSSAVYGNYGISTVTFIPTAGNTSTVTIGFKATTKSGKTNTGTITMVCSVRASALKFSDVGYNWSWAVGAVDYASSWGIVGGMGNGFQPGTTMNRAMLVTVLYRIAGSPSVSGTNPFKDVKSGTFYYSAVIWAYRNGIVTGKTASTFDPNGAVTRQEIAAILWRYAGSPSGSGSLYGYTDASSVSSYAVSAMQWAVGSGVISGKGTRLAPKDSGTRAEVTVMLHRYLAK